MKNNRTMVVNQQEKQFVQCFQLSMEDFKEMITNAVKSVIPQQQKNSAKIISLNNVSNPEDDILTREEVKNILKVSYPTLWKFNNEGTLKIKQKIGRRVYYSKKDLNNLLNNVA
ncbi:hypothetical protein CW731_03180 [Polaribacter sp. ALD11]|uniref:helix-turn-helix transcriptional regulator n=1 Tax=Polaribacter sp. ALD11 TaxID=2058137 RepID=UPI000C30C46A|nr:helix-turn-helix domain-containing protein [Polaribacter sp. ALD11]AUC84359.1 hypothetical protein CW731_03180 [Polaribacter sp. ALD11]